MSTMETVLTRMMKDPTFAEAVFANAGQALNEYDLSAEELSRFKDMSRVDFEALTAVAPEERKSLASRLSAGDLADWQSNYGAGG